MKEQYLGLFQGIFHCNARKNKIKKFLCFFLIRFLQFIHLENEKESSLLQMKKKKMTALLFTYKKEFSHFDLYIYNEGQKSSTGAGFRNEHKAVLHALLFLYSESNSNFIYLRFYISVIRNSFYSSVLFIFLIFQILFPCNISSLYF